MTAGLWRYDRAKGYGVMLAAVTVENSELKVVQGELNKTHRAMLTSKPIRDEKGVLRLTVADGDERPQALALRFSGSYFGIDVVPEQWDAEG